MIHTLKLGMEKNGFRQTVTLNTMKKQATNHADLSVQKTLFGMVQTVLKNALKDKLSLLNVEQTLANGRNRFVTNMVCGRILKIALITVAMFSAPVRTNVTMIQKK